MNSLGGKSLFAGTPCSPDTGYSCGSAALGPAGAQEPLVPRSGAQGSAPSALSSRGDSTRKEALKASH